MDFLDRLEENEERFRATQRRESNYFQNGNSSTVNKHLVTIIGCIRGIDGWYKCGFDENTKTIVPLEFIEKVLISESAQNMQKSELTESEAEE